MYVSFVVESVSKDNSLLEILKKIPFLKLFNSLFTLYNLKQKQGQINLIEWLIYLQCLYFILLNNSLDGSISLNDYFEKSQMFINYSDLILKHLRDTETSKFFSLFNLKKLSFIKNVLNGNKSKNCSSNEVEPFWILILI